eukprot:CAMPEP_0172660776 /NCGR_PEP_ID=MMETSP1074-20121228/4253_1 /TAXON_ID=2916 /ORGANISM="Ceratium fusus, Strain PA161109" /LENGTH=711 /DNA_ID=CAMNT_0013476425 /DNA_START=58 /DNA_END=2193 /DNA_ORIENTATION=+
MAKFIKVKKVMKAKRVQRLRGSQDSFRSLLMNKLRKEGGRADLKCIIREQVPKHIMDMMLAVPLHKRAGYPVARKKGSFDPKNWQTVEGKKVIVDFSRESWLPDEYSQGVKSTNKLACKKGGNGGTYTVYMNPEGRTFYHKWQVEDATGETYSISHGWNGVVRLAQLTLETMRLDSDASFFKLLSARERAVLPKISEFYFAVVSARRTRSDKGLKGIATVQTAFKSAGVDPVWYVDAESLEEYRALGLNAKVGGKLTPARNMALRDARKYGKVCVQSSDDISQWEYRHGKKAEDRSMDALNAAHKAAEHYVISPVQAARFMVAKMRAAPEEVKPKLGGVYCLASCSRTFAGDVESRYHFCIGDFFVDDHSKITFDENLTLKEDYDFTCAHIQEYGSVMRINRMTVTAKHYSNEGGACSNRDAKGVEERKNIAILMRKWPNAIFDHRRRQNEVNLRWKEHCEEEEEKDEGRTRKANAKRGRVKPTIRKRSSSYLPLKGVLIRTCKKALSPYIETRLATVANRTMAAVCAGSLRFTDASGTNRVYSLTDARYDVMKGYLTIKCQQLAEKPFLKPGIKPKTSAKLAKKPLVKPKTSAMKDLQELKYQQDEVEATINRILPEATLDEKSEESFALLMDGFLKHLLKKALLKETSAKSYVRAFSSLFKRDLRSYEASAGEEYKTLIKESPQNKKAHGQYNAAVSHFRSFYQVMVNR